LLCAAQNDKQARSQSSKCLRHQPIQCSASSSFEDHAICYVSSILKSNYFLRMHQNLNADKKAASLFRSVTFHSSAETACPKGITLTAATLTERRQSGLNDGSYCSRNKKTVSHLCGTQPIQSAKKSYMGDKSLTLTRLLRKVT